MRVLLLKEELPSDPYRARLEHAGYRVDFLPPLSFVPEAPETWQPCLARPDAYSGLILTSPRAIQLVVEQFEKHPGWLEAWREHPFYVVGRQSARPLEERGLQVHLGNGTAASLAEHIVQQHPDRTRPLLFLCGDRRRAELPQHLRYLQIPFEERTIYRTVLRTDLPRPEPMPDWLVFFSPSGVEAALTSFGELPTRILAIGPTTAAALESRGITPNATAASPSPQGVLSALKTAKLS